MPAPCEQNIIDVPLSPSTPGPDDMILFTLGDGTSILRKWSVISAGLVPNDQELQVEASGASNINHILNGNGQVFLPNFIGRRLRVIRGSVPQYTSLGQYTWNSATNELNVTPVPTTSEWFRFEAY